MTAPALQPVAEFAWRLRNRVRPLGLHRLGLPCPLQGSGMAFPWPLIRGTAVADGHLTEDLKLGIDLACAGAPPAFCPEAVVTSRFPAGEAALRGQRTRWEHGHLALLLGAAPRLVLHAARLRRPELLMLALDLCVPPLALLVLLTGVALFISLLALAFTSSLLPFALVLVAQALLFGAILAAWHDHGRDVVSLAQLLRVTAYLRAKLPIYFGFLFARQVEWVRSKREMAE